MISFLLGAGASKKALPLGVEIPLSMVELANKLKNREIRNDSLNRFISDLFWLSEKAKEHESIDAYAKKLHMQIIKESEVYQFNSLFEKVDKSKEYKRLKDTLNIFLILTQFEKLDNRYNKFLSHILQKERASVFSVKNSIRIITWNYDYQIESAFCDYYQSSITKDVFAMLASYPSPFFLGDKYYHPHNNNNFDIDKYKVSIIHLNGVVGLYNNKEGYDMVDLINLKNYDTLLESAFSIYNSNDTFLNFAWDDNSFDLYPDLAMKETLDTETLVIIGYSFPLFNKETDDKIIKNMKKLKRIYIQDIDPKRIKDSIIRRNIVSSDIEFVCESNIDRFLIPDEIK